IGQRSRIAALGAALLQVFAEPEPPLGPPLSIPFTGMHRQQAIGGIALGGLAQGIRPARAKVFRRADQLLAEVGQWQAQRQTPVLGGTAQRSGAVLAIADQAAAAAAFVQPP